MSGLHDQTDESCLGRFWATQNKNKLMAAWIQVVLASNCYFLEGLQTPVTQTEEGTHNPHIMDIFRVSTVDIYRVSTVDIYQVSTVDIYQVSTPVWSDVSASASCRAMHPPGRTKIVAECWIEKLNSNHDMFLVREINLLSIRYRHPLGFQCQIFVDSTEFAQRQ